MREIQWQLKETFTFPDAAGKPISADLVQVTPRYTVDRSEDSVKLTGIYHITARVDLDKENNAVKPNESAILIDDIELETGYFEYAAPFNIDLPPEANDPLKMNTSNANSEIDDAGNFSVIWDVQCTYKEIVVVMDQEESAEIPEKVEQKTSKKSIEEQPQVDIEETVAIHESTSFSHNEDEALSFIAELDDGISKTLFRSNDVLVKSKS